MGGIYQVHDQVRKSELNLKSEHEAGDYKGSYWDGIRKPNQEQSERV